MYLLTLRIHLKAFLKGSGHVFIAPLYYVFLLLRQLFFFNFGKVFSERLKIDSYSVFADNQEAILQLFEQCSSADSYLRAKIVFKLLHWACNALSPSRAF